MGNDVIRDICVSKKQALALTTLTGGEAKYVLYGGAAGGGKTYLAVLWLMLSCYWYPGTRWFLGREELKRIRESALVTFYKVVGDYRIPSWNIKYNGSDHYLQFHNGSRVDLLDLKYLPRDPFYERYGSIEYTGGVIEEGGEVEFKAFDVLKTRVGRYMNDRYGIPGKIFITANPKKNWLYTTFYKPWRAGALTEMYAFIPALARENPYLDSGYLANLDAITDNVTRERLRDGIWEYDDNKTQLITYDNILNLFTNQQATGGNKFITADIARFGKDKTTILMWNGYRVERLDVLFKNTIPQAAAEIRSLATANGIPMSRVLVDEDGIGGGVVDLLRCKGFTANARPVEVKGKQCNYDNLKSQVSFMFAEAANAFNIYITPQPQDVEKAIVEEVEQIRSAYIDDDRKVAIVKKEKVKEILGRSPDYSDALVMRMYFDLPHTTQITKWSIN